MQKNNTVDVQCRLRPAVRTVTSHARRKDTPPAGNGKFPRLTQVLALAIHFEDMVRRGEIKDFSGLARLGCLTRARVSQVMKLVWLAPDIQQEILSLPRTLAGRFPISEVAARRIANEPLWREQRTAWNQLKQQKCAV